MTLSASGKGKEMPRSRRMLPVCVLLMASCPIMAAQTASSVMPSSEVVARPDLPSTSSTLGAVPDYLIGPDDVLTLRVYDAPDISGDYRVSPAGQLELPLLPEPIVAAGLTAIQLSERIGEVYRQAQIITHPRVTVTVKEPRVHSITVAGAVKRPQIYPVYGRTTLIDVLSQAEGLADDAGTTATVTRGEEAMQALKQSGACAADDSAASCAKTFAVDLKQLLEMGDPHLNVPMYPGDRVTVQHAGIIYVVGAVNRPGGFLLKSGQEDMTVLWALALAHEFTNTASRKKALLIRKNPAEKDGREEIKVNLKDILAGRGDDLRLQANDILIIADSEGKRALHRTSEAAVQAATFGAVVYH